MLRRIEISQENRWGAVGIQPTDDLHIAKVKWSTGLNIVIPPGAYALIAHDNDIALLRPLKTDHPHWMKRYWVTEIRNIVPRPPIYSKDFPIIVDSQTNDRPCVHHDAPAATAKLWRYICFSKFEKMIQQAGIFLARADTFSDKLEGTLSPANAAYRADVYRDNEEMAHSHEKAVQEFEKMKRWTYVSCWRIDETESERPWTEYIQGSDGVAIQTTYANLAWHAQCVFCARVRYVDFKETWIIENNSLMPFMHKDAGQFSWENEFRIILQRFPERPVSLDQTEFYACESENPALGQILRLDLNSFIDEIVIAPGASLEFEACVHDLADRHGFGGKVRRSRYSNR